MENIDNKNMVNRSGKVWAGLVIVVLGAVMLLNNFGLHLPHWVFSWSTLLIVIGLFVGARHNFKKSGWFVIVLIGFYFTAEDIFRGYDFGNVVFPIMLLIFGVYLIVKPKGTPGGKRGKQWSNEEPVFGASVEPLAPLTQTQDQFDERASQNARRGDYIESTNVFAASNQIIYSKNLQGGEITAVFGGGDINLTQADFRGEVVLDVTAIFGGVKIIIPANWQVKSEITAIFGGLDDKRALYPVVEGQPEKLIIIRGVVLLGGVEFKSF